MQAALKSAGSEDVLLQEQFLDFVRMRAYRETLLCRADRAIQRGFPAEHFRRLLLATQTSPASGEAPGASAFVLPGGIRMESNHPGVTALLRELGKAWPGAIAFEALEPRLAESGFALAQDGASWLIRLAVAKMIELRAWNAPAAASISERPRASACCRQEARSLKQTTSLLHMTVSLEDDKVRSLLKLLDGTRGRLDLLEAMKAEFPAAPARELEEGLDPNLRLLHIAGILEG